MRPENVQVSTPTTNKESRTVIIIWNGTWPSDTVFVVMARWQKKGMSAAQSASQGWRELKQVQIKHVELVIVGYTVSEVCNASSVLCKHQQPVKIAVY